MSCSPVVKEAALLTSSSDDPSKSIAEWNRSFWLEKSLNWTFSLVLDECHHTYIVRPISPRTKRLSTIWLLGAFDPF